MDPIKNDALVAVSTGYAAGATSIVLTTGEGTKLPDPSIDGAFTLAWWNSTDYKAPHEDPNRERIRVTARSVDTLTILRAQEGTSDVAHNTAGKQYMMALVFSKKMYDEFVDAITHNVVANAIESKAFSFQTGKLGQAIRINRFSNTVGDLVSFPRGTQISGNNYTNINTNQGTISFWVKTDWGWNDGLEHYIFTAAAPSSDFTVYKSDGNVLRFQVNGVVLCGYSGASTLLKNTWYYVSVRWDADNVVTAGKYAQIFVNGVEQASRASSFTTVAPNANSYVGSRGPSTPALGGYIDDLGISDRVATDAEIAALYNTGTGATFDSVMGDAHLKFYAPFDGTVGTAVVETGLAGGAGNMWTGSLAADGTMEAAGVTSYTQEGSPSTFAKTTTASELLFDTQALKCVGVSDGDGYEQSVTVVALSTYHVEFYKRVDAGTLRLIVDGQEFIVNGDMEAALASLNSVLISTSVARGTVSSSSAQAKSGVNSALYTPDGSVGTNYFRIGNTTTMNGMVVGRKYTLRIWCFVPSGLGHTLGTIAVRLFKNGEATQVAVSSVPTSFDAWNELFLTFTVPSDATSLTFRAESGSSLTAADISYWEDITLREIYAETTFTNSTYDKFETEIKVTGTTLRVRWLQSGATAATWLVDGLLCVANKIANGGMEGTYVSGIAPSWVSFLEGAHLILSESATAYTGAKSQSIQITSAFGGVLQTISRTVGKFYLFSLAFRKASAGSLSTAIRWSDGSSSWSKYLTATAAATWTKKSFVRKTAAGEHTQIAIGHGNVDTVLVDDAFIFELASVDLTITAITGRIIVGEALVLLKAGTTGSGSALLGSNFPGATPGAPFTWKTVILEDGSIGYQPVWK